MREYAWAGIYQVWLHHDKHDDVYYVVIMFSTNLVATKVFKLEIPISRERTVNNFKSFDGTLVILMSKLSLSL